MWNTAKVICPFLAASINPMSRSALRVGGLGRIERVENLHLVGHESHVNDFRYLGMKALEGAAGCLGVEGARGNLLRNEIVEQCSSDRRFAHAALVRSHDDDCWFCHWLSPESDTRLLTNPGAKP